MELKKQQPQSAANAIMRHRARERESATPALDDGSTLEHATDGGPFLVSSSSSSFCPNSPKQKTRQSRRHQPLWAWLVYRTTCNNLLSLNFSVCPARLPPPHHCTFAVFLLFAAFLLHTNSPIVQPFALLSQTILAPVCDVLSLPRAKPRNAQLHLRHRPTASPPGTSEYATTRPGSRH
jgi:hypothetical protein